MTIRILTICAALITSALAGGTLDSGTTTYTQSNISEGSAYQVSAGGTWDGATITVAVFNHTLGDFVTVTTLTSTNASKRIRATGQKLRAVVSGGSGTQSIAFEALRLPPDVTHPTNAELSNIIAENPSAISAAAGIKTSNQFMKFIAVGDSITDRMSDTQTTWDGNPVTMDCSGWGTALEALSGQRLRSIGKDTEWKTDREHGYSGISCDQFLNGVAWLGSVIPINEFDEHSSEADVVICHIGTNDVIGQTAAATANEIYAVWDRLVASGKPVIGTDILQRASTYSGWNSTNRDLVDSVNALLRANWRTHGLIAYRTWNDLISKDSSGYAAATEFPNDGLHPTQRVGFKLGKDLWDFMKPFTTGLKPTIPFDGSSRWLTPNPYVSGSVSNGGSFIATSWNAMSLGTEGVDWSASKVTDANGVVWQRLTKITAQAYEQVGMYSRITSGLPAVGTVCRVSAVIRIPAGQSINSISVQVQQVNASNPWMAMYSHGGGTSTVSGLADGIEEATFLSEPFQIQPGATQLWIGIALKNTGQAIVDFRQAGIFLN